jgi:hypothetical protein
MCVGTVVGASEHTTRGSISVRIGVQKGRSETAPPPSQPSFREALNYGT